MALWTRLTELLGIRHPVLQAPMGGTAGGRLASAVSEAGGLGLIGGGLGALGAGAFGMNSDFEDETAEFAWITRLAKETGRPVWFLLTDRPTDPERWRRIMAGVHQARAAGASVTAQVAGRPVGVILGIATSLNPFAVRERYKPFEALPLSERLCRLRDPAVRRVILDLGRPRAQSGGRPRRGWPVCHAP